MMRRSKEGLRDIVITAKTVLVHWHEKEKRGELTRAQAQARAISTIESLRYGKELKDYFWINDTHPKMVVHPYRSDLNGKDLTDYADPNGKHPFVEMAKVVAKNKEGYVDYVWQYKDVALRIMPKTSFVTIFEPWDWIIGSGIYLGDVHKEIAQKSQQLMLICVFIVVLTSLVVIYFTASLIKSTESLHVSERRLRTVLNSATQTAIVSTDVNGLITSFNVGAERILGYTAKEVVDKKTTSLFHDKDEAPDFTAFTKVPGEQGFETKDWTCYRKSGEKIIFNLTVTALRNDDNEIVGYLGVGRDVTEARVATEKMERLEAQLLHSQKMEAIGTLAGGIAHDFNNILFAASGLTQLAIFSIDDKEEAKGYLKEVLAALKRAADLIKQIMTFSRKGEVEWGPLHIETVLGEALKLVRGSIPSTVTINSNLQCPDHYVRADATQMHQIIVNMCTNAYHAIRPNRGTIDINLEVVELTVDEPSAQELPCGTYAKLTIADSGSGMDEETCARIFEPYFTTKDMGDGTGLGLATVHGIIHRHGGSISVTSEKGKGTTFTIYLPTCVKTEDASNDEERAAKPAEGSERVLFVDDEALIARFATTALNNLGYDVTAFEDSLQALEEFKENSEAYDVVIVDQMMPNLTGDELAKEILAVNPNVPIILCTGFSDTMTREKALKCGFRDYLQKPIDLKTLAASMRRALE